MAEQTHYEVLGVANTCTEKEVTQAYRILVRQHHPDRVGPSGEAMTMLLNFAFDILSDPAKRRKYDQQLGAESEPPPAGNPQGGPPPPNWPPPPPPSAPSVPPAPEPLVDMRREPDASQASASSSWTSVPDQSYRVQEPSPVNGPTKRDWALAFPPGSRPRLTFLAASILTIAGGLALVLLMSDSGSALWALLSTFGGLLLLKKRPHYLAYVITAAMMLVGAAGVVWEALTSQLGGSGLWAAGIGWVALALFSRSWRTLRRRHVEARDWVILEQVAVATGDGPLWVRAVDRGLALVEDGASGVQRTIPIWGDVQAGTWVVLNSAGNIVDTTPGTAFDSWQWVAEDRVKRAAKDSARHPSKAVQEI